MRKVTENAYKQYIRSRPLASPDSNRRVKELSFNNCGIHPIFKTNTDDLIVQKEDLLTRMKSYRPHGVIIVLIIFCDKLNFPINITDYI